METQNLRLGANHYGKCVIATEEIKPKKVLLKFEGPLLKNKDIDKSGKDLHLQIGEDLYLGASGKLDDRVNHSCDPNCILHQDEHGDVLLVSIKTIPVGGEVTFDYSTSIGDGFELVCKCNAENCRGLISDFSKLPKYLRAKYLKLGGVLNYLKDKA